MEVAWQERSQHNPWRKVVSNPAKNKAKMELITKATGPEPEQVETLS